MTCAALKTLVTPPSSLVRQRRTSVVSAIVDLSSRLARTCMCACVNACVTGAVALCSVPTPTSSSYADWETVLSLFVRNGKIYQTAVRTQCWDKKKMFSSTGKSTDARSPSLCSALWPLNNMLWHAIFFACLIECVSLLLCCPQSCLSSPSWTPHSFHLTLARRHRLPHTVSVGTWNETDFCQEWIYRSVTFNSRSLFVYEGSAGNQIFLDCTMHGLDLTTFKRPLCKIYCHTLLRKQDLNNLISKALLPIERWRA